eukprot:7382519-Prymnesium_polylepis.1
MPRLFIEASVSAWRSPSVSRRAFSASRSSGSASSRRVYRDGGVPSSLASPEAPRGAAGPHHLGRPCPAAGVSRCICTASRYCAAIPWAELRRRVSTARSAWPFIVIDALACRPPPSGTFAAPGLGEAGNGTSAPARHEKAEPISSPRAVHDRRERAERLFGAPLFLVQHDMAGPIVTQTLRFAHKQPRREGDRRKNRGNRKNIVDFVCVFFHSWPMADVVAKGGVGSLRVFHSSRGRLMADGRWPMADGGARG